MNAIIVPGITDLNKGDQALAWESYRLVNDLGLFSRVFMIASGDNAEERKRISGQSLKMGYFLLENIMPHPRRGKHRDNEYVTESKFQLSKQILNALFDFINTKVLLTVCENLNLVKALFPSKVYRTLKHFHEADAVFVKGGGFIHAYGEKTAPYLMWYFLFYVRLAKKLRKKVIFLPNSFGPFQGLTVKSQIKYVFDKLDLVYARDNLSSEKLGILLKRHIPVEFDLGFFLKEGSQKSVDELLEKYNLSRKDKIIGLTIRPWRFPGYSEPDVLYKKYINTVAEFSKFLIRNGFVVALCNQSLGPNSHEDDRNAIRDLCQIIEHPKLVWINEDVSCDLLKALYSCFYLFIGTRFHSIIFSLTSKVPSIAIAYGGNKAQGIMDDFELGDFVVKIEDVNPELLIQKFTKALAEYEMIKIKINNSLSKITSSRERLIADIQNILRG